MSGPNPKSTYPIKNYTKLVFLKNFIEAKNIFVGDYTYFDDCRYGPEKFEEYNVLYNYDFSKAKLIIGKFCAIAAETRFIMTGDHKLDGISTYPFPIFGHGWESAFNIHDLPVKGDIVVGNDVWFAYDSLVMSGVTIGNGAIIAARAVVVKDVPAYSVVAGNPARVVKMRFEDKTIERLQKIAWWDWDIEKINCNLELICNLDIDLLEEAHSNQKMNSEITIRGYDPEDAHNLADIYYNTIHSICSQDYDPDQINAWAPKSSKEDLKKWTKKFEKTQPLVAVSRNQIVGFAEFEPNGYIDCFYCHRDWIRKGVGSALMEEIFHQAKDKGIKQIFAEVSITAKSFFQKQGFSVVSKQAVHRRGIELINYKMEKSFSEFPF